KADLRCEYFVWVDEIGDDEKSMGVQERDEVSHNKAEQFMGGDCNNKHWVWLASSAAISAPTPLKSSFFRRHGEKLKPIDSSGKRSTNILSRFLHGSLGLFVVQFQSKLFLEQLFSLGSCQVRLVSQFFLQHISDPRLICRLVIVPS
ncbi:hypothetical protein PIB30_058528, partial [Stylosanthes scabra]|nr:hypothetical protein [Stylosanthes scabra]